MRLKTAFAATLLLAMTASLPAASEDLRYCDHGKQLSRQRQHAEAIRYFNHCIQAGQLSAQSMVSALLKRGKSLALTKQLEFAIRDFTAAIQYAPNSAAAYHNRGVAYAKASRMDEALADLSKAIQLAPQELSSYLGRAVIYKARGEQKLAASDAVIAKRLAQGG